MVKIRFDTVKIGEKVYIVLNTAPRTVQDMHDTIGYIEYVLMEIMDDGVGDREVQDDLNQKIFPAGYVELSGDLNYVM